MNRNGRRSHRRTVTSCYRYCIVLRRSEEAQPWLLVLMHGVGSNEEDLFGLADFVPAPFHVVSLRAPFVLGPGSYAWFEFSVAADGSRRIDRTQEAASREAVVRTVQAVARNWACHLSAWCSAASARAASWR